MPELPEVETVRLGLVSLIVGKSITKITHDRAKSFPNPETEVSKFAIGAKIIDVRRRAKVLMIDLSTGYTFVIHLKMTGQLVFVGQRKTLKSKSEILKNNKNKKEKNLGFGPHDLEFSETETRFGAGHPNNSLVGNLPDKSTRVDFFLGDSEHLYFNDQRKFGWVRLMPTIAVAEIDFMKKVGPEPLEDDFRPKVLIKRLQKRKNSSIKAALLDQTVLAGVGNIYADESLWGASIHPASLVRDLSNARLTKLHSEIIYVLKLSIEKGGSTDRNYVNAEGKRGSYIDFARVFRKEGDPCPRCQTTIIKTRVAGRGTHLCPSCQQL
jgi:formamidopyrimidine-DNA glycosylase